MKNLILIFTLIISLTATSLSAQTTEGETPRSMVGLDVHPKYPGPETFQQYVAENIKNVRITKSQRIKITFVVEKDGSLTNITFSDGVEKNMRKKIIKTFKKSKRWAPGMQNDKIVRVQYTLPINLTITG